LSTITQDSRGIGIETSLGKDVFLLLNVEGAEAISEQYCYSLSLAAERRDINAKEIVGQQIDFWILNSDGNKQYYNGYVSQFRGGALVQNGFRSYQMQIVPWSWFLGKNQNYRIFQEKTASEIIEEIFNEFSFSVFQNNCQSTFPKLDYCVQYKESSLNFIVRLAQEYGIFFFFTHEKGKHTLVLADKATAYLDCGESKVIQTFGGEVAQRISSWNNEFDFFTGQLAQSDFNFETPSANLSTSTSTIIDHPLVTDYESFNYPGKYSNTEDGRKLTDLRMIEEEATHSVVQAESNYQRFFVGSKFIVAEHDFAHEVGKSYVITQLKFSISENSYFHNDSPSRYSNFFSAIPANVPCYSFLKSNKPRVIGPQTAIVVGPAGEPVYTDKYGRVKVQFHWDRVGTSDESSSCWVRVSQNWAGKNWGSVALPHIGNEVIVSFLNGDPDRPIVTGRVYNAEQMPAEAPQENAHKNITRDKYGNEIILDATPGDEHIRLYSPHHESVMELGKSFSSSTTSDTHWFSNGNKFEASIGNNGTFAGGTKAAVFVGASVAANFGVSAGFDMAFKYNLALTGAYSITAGSSESYNFGPREDHSAADVKSSANGNHIIAAGKELCLAGNTAAGINIPIFTASAKKIGMSTSSTPPTPIAPAINNWCNPPASKLWMVERGLEISANVTMLAACILAFVGCFKASNSNDNVKWNITFNMIGIALGVFSTVLTGIKLGIQYANKKANQPIEHVAPYMAMELDQMKGVVVHSAMPTKPVSITHGLSPGDAEIKLGGPSNSPKRVSIRNNVTSEISMGPTGIALEEKGAGVDIKAMTDINLEAPTGKISFKATEVNIDAPGVGFKVNYNLIVLP